MNAEFVTLGISNCQFENISTSDNVCELKKFQKNSIILFIRIHKKKEGVNSDAIYH